MKLANGEPIYTVTHFELADYSTTRYASSIRNVIGRIISLVAKAITEHHYLPKALVFVLDDNILKQINLPNKIKQPELQFIIHFLVEKINRLLNGYKDKLPSKAKLQWYPHILWIIPPTHKYFSNNTEREFFSTILEEEVCQDHYPNMCTLCLKKVWDDQDGAAFLSKERRFTPVGYSLYWLAVDAAIQFWNKTLCEVLLKKTEEGDISHYHCTFNKESPSTPSCAMTIDFFSYPQTKTGTHFDVSS